MRTNKRALGGLVAAVVAALSVTACDPYMKANGDAPVVLGVTLIDTNYNEYAPVDDGTCTAPYPQVYKTWADQAFPGLCEPANIAYGIPTVCPVLCFPPRTGPGFAPLYMGNLGGSYQTAPTMPGASPGTYTYTLASSYTINNAPPFYVDTFGGEFEYGQIRIQMNKLLDPATVQRGLNDPRAPLSPPTGTPAGGTALKVYRAGVDVTETYTVYYDPTSDTSYWGGSINVTSPTMTFDQNTQYRVAGWVADQQGNVVLVDVTVNMGTDIL